MDFGCGSADLLAYYAEIAGRAVGVDFSESMLAAARARLAARGAINVTIFKADDQNLWEQLGSQKFDAITAGQVFQYFNLARIERFFAETLRFLTPAGRIVIFDLIDPRIYFLRELGVFADRPIDRPVAFARRLISGAARLAINSCFPRLRETGRAHYPRDICRAAERQGLAAEVVWSMYYEYRYHLICRQSSGPP